MTEITFWEFALNNVIRNFKIYLSYFLGCVVSIIIVFSFYIYIFHPNLTKPAMNSLVSLMSIAEIIIFMFSFLFVLYSINTFVKVRSKEFGVLMILGMTKKQINILIFLENIIISFLSLITGIILGLIFSKFFLVASEKIKITNSLYFYFPITAIMYTVVYFCILFFIISLCIPFLLRTKKINILIKEENKGDKEIKFSKIMSILSILLLSCGYLMAVSKKFKILLIFVIIIIGTFLFFSQFSIFAIEMLKKRKCFYMKKVNMIWISDLAYNMRNNSRMLFLVTILSTVTFTSVSILYLANVEMKNNIIKSYPMPFVYISLPGNDKEQQHIDVIEDSLNSGGFKFEKYKIDILHKKIDKKSKIHIIKVSEYNEIATALNMKTISLKEDEAYIVPSSNWDKKSFLISKNLYLENENIMLNSVGVAEKSFSMSFLNYKIVVVNDYLFKTIKNTDDKDIYYGFKVEDWEKTTDIVKYIDEKIDKKPKDSFIFIGSADRFEHKKEELRELLYVWLFIAVIFFIAAGSFLYLRIYSTLNQEKKKYISISKIGLTLEEMKEVATIQMAILFFTPYIMAVIHTVFFVEMFGALQGLALKLSTVLFSFFIVQFIYFLIIRSRYIKYISRFIV